MGRYRPLELELDLLLVVVELMPMENWARSGTRIRSPAIWIRNGLSSKRLRDGELGHHLLSRVDAFDISRTPGHDVSLRSSVCFAGKRATPPDPLATSGVSDLDPVGRRFSAKGLLGHGGRSDAVLGLAASREPRRWRSLRRGAPCDPVWILTTCLAPGYRLGKRD